MHINALNLKSLFELLDQSEHVTQANLTALKDEIIEQTFTKLADHVRMEWDKAEEKATQPDLSPVYPILTDLRTALYEHYPKGHERDSHQRQLACCFLNVGRNMEGAMLKETDPKRIRDYTQLILNAYVYAQALTSGSILGARDRLYKDAVRMEREFYMSLARTGAPEPAAMTL